MNEVPPPAWTNDERSGQMRIALVAPRLLDPEDGIGTDMGGGERYCVDLAGILGSYRNCEVTVLQPSVRPWQSEFHGLKVVGIGSITEPGVPEVLDSLLRRYHMTVYLLITMCIGRVEEPSVAVSHGIPWDDLFRPGPLSDEFWERRLLELGAVTRLVCVDTNHLGIVRTMWPSLGPKCRFVPNYADTKLYRPLAPGDYTDDDPFSLGWDDPNLPVVLFPRRLTPVRGFDLMLDVAAELGAKGRANFWFVGKGTTSTAGRVVEDKLRELVGLTGYIRWNWFDLNDMPAVYREADIAVIPSLGCEGTSLSCLEAMASECAVVVTNVGGLNDLVFDGYNGLKVEPEISEVSHALQRLCQDVKLCKRLGKRARGVVRASFSKQRWIEEWRHQLAEVYDLTDVADTVEGEVG